jgi:hypothetical protein
LAEVSSSTPRSGSSSIDKLIGMGCLDQLSADQEVKRWEQEGVAGTIEPAGLDLGQVSVGLVEIGQV